MSVIKGTDGSITYVVSWAVVSLLLAIGLVCLLLAFLHFASNEASFMIPDANVATASLVIGLMLVFLSLFLAYRQIHLMARLKQLQKTMDNARSGLRLGKSMGIDTRRIEELYQNAEAMASLRELRETEKVMADCRAVLESSLTLQTDKLLDRARKDMEGKRDSIGLDFSEESLDCILEELEREDYRNVSRLLRDHRVATRRVEELFLTLQKAEELGLRIDEVKERFETVLRKFNEGNSRQARIESIRMRDILSRKMKDLVRESYLRPVSEKIGSLSEKGVASKDAQRLLLQAGTHLLAADIEGSIRIASMSDEKINDEARGAIEDSLDKIEHMCIRAEKLGVDVSSYSPLIEVANENLDDGRLEESLDQLQQVEASVVQGMNSLVLEKFYSLREEVNALNIYPEGMLKFVNALEEADGERKRGNFEGALRLAEELKKRTPLANFSARLSAVESRLEDVEHADFDTSEMLSEIDRVRAFKDRTEALECLERLSREVVKAEKKIVEDLEKRMEDMNGRLAESGSQSVESSQLRGTLVEVRVQLEERCLGKASDLLELLEENYSAFEKAYAVLQEEITQLMGVISKAEHAGIPIPSSEWMKNVDKGKTILDATESLVKTREKVMEEIEELRSNAEARKEVCEDVLSRLPKQDSSDIAQILSEVETYLEEGQYQKALETSYPAQELAKERLAIRARLLDELRNAKDTISSLPLSEHILSDFNERLMKASGEGDYEDRIGTVSAILREALKLEKSMRGRYESISRKIGGRISEAQRKGIETQPLVENYEAAKESFVRNRLDEVVETLAGILQDLDAREMAWAKAQEILHSYERTVASASKAGLDTADVEIEMKKLTERKDYDEIVTKVSVAKEKLFKEVEEFGDQALALVAEAQDRIDDLAGKIHVPKAGEEISSAQHFLEEGRFALAIEHATTASNLAEETEDMYRRFCNLAEKGEDVLAGAKEASVDVSGLERTLARTAEETDYGLAIESLGNAISLTENEVEDLWVRSFENIQEATQEVEDLRKREVPISEVTKELEFAKLNFELGRFGLAIEKSKRVRELIEEVLALAREIDEAMGSLRSVLEEAENSGVSIPDIDDHVRALDGLEDLGARLSSIRDMEEEARRKVDMTELDAETLLEKVLSSVESYPTTGHVYENLHTLIQKASSLLEEQKFGKSIGALRQAGIEIAKIEDTRLEMLVEIQKNSSVAEDLRHSGIDVDDPLQKLLILSGYPDFWHAIDVCKSLYDDFKSTKEAREKQLGKRLRSLSSSVEDLVGKGIDVTEVRQLMKQGTRELREGRFLEAEESYELAEEKRAHQLVLHRKLVEVVNSSEDMFTEMDAAGLETEEMRQEFDRSRQLLPYGIAIGSCAKVRARGKKVLATAESEARSLLEELEEHVEQLASNGVWVEEIENLMAKADEELVDGRYALARESIEKAKQAADKTASLFYRSREVIASAKGDIESAFLSGIDVGDIEEHVRAAEEGTDYEFAIQAAEDARAEALKRKTELELEVKSELERLESSFNEMIREGMKANESFEQPLSESRELLHEGRFSDSRFSIRRAENIALNLWDLYTAMKEAIQGSREEIRKMDASIGKRVRDKVQHLTHRLDELEDITDYETGHKEASDTKLEATGLLERFKADLVNGLAELQARLDDMEQRDLDIGTSKGLSDQANQDLEVGLIGEGLDLLDEAGKEIERIEQQRKIAEGISSIEDEISEAERQGVAVEDLQGEIPKAEDVVDLMSFDQKLDDLRSLLHDRKDKLRISIQQDIDSLWNEARSVEASGVSIDRLTRLLEESEGKLRDDCFIEAKDLIVNFSPEKESLMRVYGGFAEVLDKARGKEPEAAKAGIDHEDLRDLLEKVSVSSNYEESTALLEEAVEDICARIEESSEKAKNAIEEARAKLEELRIEEVMNLRIAEDEFASATTKWNEGLYEDAYRITRNTLEACETARKEHEAFMARKTKAEVSLQNMESYLEEMRADDIVALLSVELGERAGSLFEEGKFEDAGDKAEEALHLAREVRETYELAMDGLRNIRDDSEQAESRGVDISGLTDDVDLLAEGHSYYELELAVEKTREDFSSRIEARKEEVRGDISSQKELIDSLLEDEVMSASPGMDLLEEASKKVEEESFVEAVDLVRRASEIATEASMIREERNRALAEVEKVFSRVDKARVETDDFSKRLKTAQRETDDVNATTLLDELSQMMLRILSEKRELVTESIEDSLTKVGELHREVLDVSDVEHMISEAKAKVDEGFLSDAEVKIQSAKVRIRELGDMVVERRELADKAERTLWEAKKAGVESGQFYVNLEKARLNPNVHESMAGIKEVIRNTHTRIKELKQGAEVLLNSVQARMLELEEKGIINKELASVQSSAEQMSRIGNYGDAIRLCDKVVAMADETEKSFRLLQELMDKAQRHIGKAWRLGIETDDLIERLGKARSLDDYEQAIEIVREMISDTGARFEEKGVQVLPTIEGREEAVIGAKVAKSVVDISAKKPKEGKAVLPGEEVVLRVPPPPDEVLLSRRDAEKILTHLKRVVDFSKAEKVQVQAVAGELEKAWSSLDNPDRGRIVSKLREEIDDLRQNHLLDKCRCGAQNPEGSRFCSICGGGLEVDDLGRALAIGIERICPRCSRLYEGDSSFCEVCGIELGEAKDLIPKGAILRDAETGNEVSFAQGDERVLGRRDFLEWLPAEKRDYISRKHFKFFWKGRRIYLEHISATNPTKVNGRPIPKGGSCELKKGDRIDLAEGVLVLEVDISS